MVPTVNRSGSRKTRSVVLQVYGPCMRRCGADRVCTCPDRVGTRPGGPGGKFEVKSVQCMGKTRSVCMGNPVGHMQVRPLGSLWDRSVTCSSYWKDRPVIPNNIKPLGSSWDRSGEMVMNKVGGAGSAVLHLPYIIATRFITRWFRAHWDCMLWGKSTFTPSHFQRLSLIHI